MRNTASKFKVLQDITHKGWVCQHAARASGRCSASAMLSPDSRIYCRWALKHHSARSRVCLDYTLCGYESVLMACSSLTQANIPAPAVNPNSYSPLQLQLWLEVCREHQFCHRRLVAKMVLSAQLKPPEVMDQPWRRAHFCCYDGAKTQSVLT